MEALSSNSLIEWGVATLALGGQSVSGDQYLMLPFSDGLLAAVVDGLGHGQEAAAASKIAVTSLEAYAQSPIINLIQRCHTALLKTRGVVMSIALFNAPDETLTWLGVGNVAGVLLRADPQTSPAQENLLLRGGVVGYQLPSLSAAVLPVRPGDTLIFATDGLDDDFASGVFLGDPPQRLATRILAHHGKGTDDALVLVARWKGSQASAEALSRTQTPEA